MKTLKESTREKILESAADEFARSGFAKTNIDNISVNAGFGKGTIYNYFKNKLDLFLAIVTKYTADLIAEIELAIKNISDPVEKMKQVIAIDFHFISKNRDLCTIILKESYTVDKNRQKDFLEATYPIFKIYSDLIAEGVATGCYGHDIDPNISAASIMGMIESVALMNVLVDYSLGTMDELVERIVNILLKGIEKK